MKRILQTFSIFILVSLILTGCDFGHSGALASTTLGASAPSNTSEAGLTVYFIDVGQADSALVICDGSTMLIDGGNAADSDLIYTFLKKS